MEERKNRYIVGAVRAMLHDQSLPFFLWAEACSTVVYLQNRSLRRVVGNKTPKESFTGKKPEVSHFRIFGCLTYSHVPSGKRTKFEPTAERGIFVGYDETSKAFRIYLPSLRKVVVRKEVRFEEEQAFRNSTESEQEDKCERPSKSHHTPQRCLSLMWGQALSSSHKGHVKKSGNQIYENDSPQAACL